MGPIRTFFFDTYALFELLSHNERYAPYLTGCGMVTSRLNLMELHYGLLRLHGKERAHHVYDRFVRYAAEISDDAIKEANAFRLLHKKRRLSYVDCLGYAMARRLGILFLTGDKQFQGMEGVEFVA